MSENLRSGLLIASLVCNFVMLPWLIGLTVVVSSNSEAFKKRDKEIEEAFQAQNTKIEVVYRSQLGLQNK